MKKISFALCLIIALFCSCQNDKDDIVKADKNPIIGNWELVRWETYNLDNEEMLESGTEVLDSDWFTSLKMQENICEVGFGLEKLQVQYTVVNKSIVFVVPDNNYSLTMPIVKLTETELVLSKDEELSIENEDGSYEYLNGQIVLYYNKK